jgi:hypothetical protein
MPVSAYQYTSNAGTVYQVQLPDDFAIALGATPAAGGEPVLDLAISPRYITYFNSVLGNRIGIPTTTAIFAAAGTTLTVGGHVYTARSYVGESQPAYIAPLFNTMQLLQGEPGPPGPPPVPPVVLDCNVAGGNVVALRITPLVGGTAHAFEVTHANGTPSFFIGSDSSQVVCNSDMHVYGTLFPHGLLVATSDAYVIGVLHVSRGANCQQEDVTLVAGAATVSNSRFGPGTYVGLMPIGPLDSTCGDVFVTSESVGSFDIQSTNPLDTRVVRYLIMPQDG